MEGVFGVIESIVVGVAEAASLAITTAPGVAVAAGRGVSDAGAQAAKAKHSINIIAEVRIGLLLNPLAAQAIAGSIVSPLHTEYSSQQAPVSAALLSPGVNLP